MMLENLLEGTWKMIAVVWLSSLRSYLEFAGG
jgi:hypothetical protein